MTIDNLKLFLMKREGITPIKIRNYLILHLFHLKSAEKFYIIYERGIHLFNVYIFFRSLFNRRILKTHWKSG